MPQDAFKCINGTCIEPPETGKAVISVVNGTFSGPVEEAGELNPYVKVYLDQKYLMKTRTIDGSNHPVFNQAFVTPFITSDTQIGFLVFNRDDSEEKLLLTVQTTVDFILAMNLNGTTTCQPQGSPRGRLCFSIKWFREVG
jgi:Ca2+-dependent lipid-binding protein